MTDTLRIKTISNAREVEMVYQDNSICWRRVGDVEYTVLADFTNVMNAPVIVHGSVNTPAGGMTLPVFSSFGTTGYDVILTPYGRAWQGLHITNKNVNGFNIVSSEPFVEGFTISWMVMKYPTV